jgi:hypothetical protein
LYGQIWSNEVKKVYKSYYGLIFCVFGEGYIESYKGSLSIS